MNWELLIMNYFDF